MQLYIFTSPLGITIISFTEAFLCIYFTHTVDSSDGKFDASIRESRVCYTEPNDVELIIKISRHISFS